MKRTISVILSLIMMLSLTLTGCAAENETAKLQENTKIVLQIGNPTMVVNGIDKPIDENGTVPVIINDRTLLPVRAVVEEMGGTVAWNGETREVTLNCDENEIKLIIDSKDAYLNGEKTSLDTAPTIINDRTMLPIRFIAESFNFDVAWEEASQTITITKKDVTKTEQNEIPVVTENDEETASSKTLVVYFSFQGATKSLAEKFVSVTGADVWRIAAKEPYGEENLRYYDETTRAYIEQNNNTSVRPEIVGEIDNLADYDTILLGYPIWYGKAPRIIFTFIETYKDELKGKTIIPFCTSMSSGISGSIPELKSAIPDSDVKDGFRGTDATTEKQVEEYLKNID